MVLQGRREAKFERKRLARARASVGEIFITMRVLHNAQREGERENKFAWLD